MALMEIYRNSTASKRQVTLPFPIYPLSPIGIFVEREGEEPVELPTAVVAYANEQLALTVPLNLTHTDSDFSIRWEISYIEGGETYSLTERTPVSVVTPILTDAEIRSIDTDVFADPAEVVKIEKAVRHIIQAYTGQEFGHFHGTENIRGDGGTALFLPRRLIELKGVNGTVNPVGYVTDPDGYILRHYPWGVPPVKADYFGLHMHTGGVIHNPNNVSLRNWSKRTYSIDGRWGWEEVPGAVKEAAKLLVNDYACADSQYRDRYLQSMTAADWRIQFNSGAFLRTGNVRADQLLSDFVVTRGWGVI